MFISLYVYVSVSIKEFDSDDHASTKFDTKSTLNDDEMYDSEP
jgi:hypothetical protein